MLMKIVVLFLACLVSATVSAQPHGPRPMREFESGRPPQTQEDMRLRRERMQEFRQQMRNRQQASERDDRPSSEWRNQDREFANDERPRGLRRLNQDERQRLRQEMREAYQR